MSLPEFDLQGSLFESLESIAADLFEESDKYKVFATKIWPLLARSRQELAECYTEDNGRPGIEPVVLLGVLIFQFLERVPDRQAAELVKYHLGWKLALNLKVSYQGFHPTMLTKFRERLERCEKRDLAMRTIMEGLQNEGLVAKRSKQRLDSTHILGAVAGLSSLECVRETLALALEELAGQLAVQERPEFWDLLLERYVESKLDYKSSEATLQAKRQQAGVDCLRLLHWLEPLGTEIRQGRQVVLLREVFAQQYMVKQGGEIEPVKVHGTGVVQNPHDRDAQWSAKGQGKQKKDWVGYKVQVAETVASDQSSFISSVVTQRATESDDAGLPATLQKQQALGFERPAEFYVDGAYISGRAIDQAKEEGWQLMGPAQPSASRAGLEKAYRIEAFDISIAQRKAVCPDGKTSTNCSKLTEEKSGKVSYRFEFGSQCHDCRLKGVCLPSTQPHRTITVGTHHESLQQRRRDQQSEEFQLRMHQRNAIEGTISELVRGHGLRRASLQRFCEGGSAKSTYCRRLQYKKMVPKAAGNLFFSRAEGVDLRGIFSGAF